MTNRSAQPTRSYEKTDKAMDRLLADHPPVIEWVRRGLVMVAVQVDDPHTEQRLWNMGRHRADSAALTYAGDPS